jgi:hypothetical protein
MSVRTLALASVIAGVALHAFPACKDCSPDGRYQLARGNAERTLIVTDAAGETRVLAPLDDDGATAILRSGWRSNEVVWAEAHVSPYNSVYYEWDAANGRVIRRAPESRLDVSADGRHVAWVEPVAVHPRDDADQPALSIDGVEVSTPHGAVKALAWSPTGDELAVAIEHGTAATIAVYSAESRTVSRTFGVPAAATVLGLRWLGNRIAVRTNRGEQTFE